MLAAVTPTSTHEVPPHQEMLPAEADFYADYDWCLDPHLTIGEATDRLRGEIGRLDVAPDGWQFGEVASNVFLLSCALLNGLDEYLRGPTLRMPGKVAARRIGRGGRWMAEKTAGRFRRRAPRKGSPRKEYLEVGLGKFFALFGSETPIQNPLFYTSR